MLRASGYLYAQSCHFNQIILHTELLLCEDACCTMMLFLSETAK